MFLILLILLSSFDLNAYPTDTGHFVDRLFSSFFDEQFKLDLRSIEQLESNVQHKVSLIDARLRFEEQTISCPLIIYQHHSIDIQRVLHPIVCLQLLDHSQTLSYSSSEFRRSSNIDELLFDKFKLIHARNYSNDRQENQEKLRIFKENLRRIEFLNDNEQGTARYVINQYSDLSENQFRRLLLNNKLNSVKIERDNSKSAINKNRFSFPDEFDWRHFNAVTPVKNQGQCGSCWAFSVTGNIESLWKIRSGQLESLSEQELLDCDNLDEACNGGLMTNAFQQIIGLQGLMTEQDYPYRAKQNDHCLLDRTKPRVSIQTYVNISQDENDMAQWLSDNGPISIGLNANMMQFYFRGIAHPHRRFCNPDDLNHGVLIVGYGSSSGSKTIPFWIIKNSWGNHWGEKGFYRLYRGDGSCGVNRMASSAII